MTKEKRNPARSSPAPLLQVGQRIELELTDLTPSGDCVGRHEGQVVFVALGLPGERVEVEIGHVKRNWARGKIVNWLRTDPARIVAPCKHFGTCGGCHLQHLGYEAQLAYKTQFVKEQFQHIGKFDAAPVLPCQPCPNPFYYRNHIQFTIGEGEHGDSNIGFHAPRRHNVIPIDECMIAEKAINTALAAPALHHAARAQAPIANSQPIPTDPALTAIRIGNSLDMRVAMTPIHVAGHNYHVSLASFFQVNTVMAGKLVDEVLTRLDLQPSDRCLDLYCGVGLFTLPMIERCDSVVGIEMGESSTADARINLRPYMLQERVRIITADVGKALLRNDIRHSHWDKAVVDPPRSGMQYDALMSLIALHPRRIVYVSCDPATLARDAKHLRERGYTLTSAQPFDMFPQTHHVETVGTFDMSE